MILIPLVAFLVVYYLWAPNNICWTIIEEGHSKVISKMGSFRKCLINWREYTFNKEWSVIKENSQHKEAKHFLGGLRFYGIWPFFETYSYKLRWKSLRADGSAVDHEETLNSVLLKDFVYLVEIDGAEEKNKIPLDIDLLITIRVVNPYKALFRTQDWVELVMNRIKPFFREYIAQHTYEDLIGKKQAAGGDVWKELVTYGIVKEFKRDYGVEIKDGGIEMKDITPPPIYQEAATKKYLAEKEKEKRAEETMGMILQMLADAYGMSPDEVRKTIHKDPKLRKDFMRLTEDLVKRKMAIEGQSFVDIRVSGAEGVEKGLLNLIAAWKRMPNGGTGEKKPDVDGKDRKQSKQNKEKAEKSMSYEEKVEALKARRRGE